MSKNGKRQLRVAKQQRLEEVRQRLIAEMDQVCGPRVREAIRPIVENLKQPAFWARRSMMAHVYFPLSTAIFPFVPKSCRPTTKGFVATHHKREWLLEFRDGRLYFPLAVRVHANP